MRLPCRVVGCIAGPVKLSPVASANQSAGPCSELQNVPEPFPCARQKAVTEAEGGGECKRRRKFVKWKEGECQQYLPGFVPASGIRRLSTRLDRLRDRAALWTRCAIPLSSELKGNLANGGRWARRNGALTKFPAVARCCIIMRKVRDRLVNQVDAAQRRSGDDRGPTGSPRARWTNQLRRERTSHLTELAKLRAPEALDVAAGLLFSFQVT